MIFRDLLGNYAEWVLLAVFVWFVIDGYLMTRYGGRLNRGITVWRRHLLEDEYRFLTSLDKDIVIKEAERGWLVKRKWVSFVAVANQEALIRYSHPMWKTSWPMVFYANLENSKPVLQYRMSLPGLLLWVAMLWIPVITLVRNPYMIAVSLFLIIFVCGLLGASIVIEIIGGNKFLVDQSTRYLALSNNKGKENHLYRQ